MSHSTAIVVSAAAAVAAVLAAAHVPPAAAQEDKPHVEYLVKSADYDISMRFSSGPNVKSESSGSVKIKVHTAMIHNYPRDVLYLVVHLTGRDTADKPVALNPGADKSASERSELPLYGRSDAIMCDALFDQPWPKLQQRLFTLEAPVSAGVIRRLRTLSFYTYAVGFEARDALPLLGDPLLREDTRAAMATWLAKQAQRRYRYVTDDGRWIVPSEVSDALPLAPADAQATGTAVKYAGEAKGAEILVRNLSQKKWSIGVAGGGRNKWYGIDAQQQGILEADAGLLAITLRGDSYTTHIAVIKENTKYTLDLK